MLNNNRLLGNGNLSSCCLLLQFFSIHFSKCSTPLDGGKKWTTKESRTNPSSYAMEAYNLGMWD